MKFVFFIFLSQVISQAGFSADSYILFTPKGSRIKSHLVVKSTQPSSLAPNYFKPKNGRPLFKILIEEELSAKPKTPQEEPTYPDKTN